MQPIKLLRQTSATVNEAYIHICRTGEKIHNTLMKSMELLRYCIKNHLLDMFL